MKTRRAMVGLVVLSGTLLVGCSENPTVPNLEDILHAELEFAGDLVTLTELEVEVRVHSDDAGTYTDFESIAVEFRADGDENWRATELELHADHFSGAKMFYSSGEYEARVVGQVAGWPDPIVLFQTTEHLHVHRIHQEVGDYVVEFETTPGHIHEGDQVEAGFWVLEAVTGGHGHAVTGLTPEIHCTDADGTAESHTAHEHTAGEYGTAHTVLEAGVVTFEIHFTDANGADHTAEFSAPVSHAH